MKNNAMKFVDMIFLAIKISVHAFIFPGYKSLIMLAFAAGITFFSVIATLLDWITFVDWRGALAGTIILGVLYLISRKEIDWDDKG